MCFGVVFLNSLHVISCAPSTSNTTFTPRYITMVLARTRTYTHNVHDIQGQDGFAGFSVVGGRDQPQLPNPGAFIITTVNKGGPADGILK